eukprot:IDg10062t1
MLETVRTKVGCEALWKRHKSTVRRTVRRRALEQHKAAKHQVELVLAHFRSVYQAEAFAHIQREISNGRTLSSKYERFGNIIQLKADCALHGESILESKGKDVIVKDVSAASTRQDMLDAMIKYNSSITT